MKQQILFTALISLRSKSAIFFLFNSFSCLIISFQLDWYHRKGVLIDFFVCFLFIILKFLCFLFCLRTFHLRISFFFHEKFQIVIFLRKTFLWNFFIFFRDLFALSSNDLSWICLICFSWITNSLAKFYFSNPQDARTVQRVRRAKW